jgi:hypothetical protein
MTVTAEQITGETWAVDLVRAYLTGDLTGLDPAAPGVDEATAQAYMEQQLAGLLSEAVVADPSFSLNQRAVIGPAGMTWLESVPMSATVRAAVWALAGDGGDHLSGLTADDRMTVFALSTAARAVAAWGPEDTIRRLDRVRDCVSRSD